MELDTPDGNKEIRYPLTTLIGDLYVNGRVLVSPSPSPYTSPQLVTMRISADAIVANTLVKAGSTPNTVAQFTTADPVTKVVGVALSGTSGAGETLTTVEITGVQCKIKADGTTTFGPGDVLEFSPSSNGRVRKGTTNPIGSAMSGASPDAGADYPVDVL
jgi:hypothetical protein